VGHGRSVDGVKAFVEVPEDKRGFGLEVLVEGEKEGTLKSKLRIVTISSM
jgi:hypothetical protein